jgi:hypothetical protein
MSGSSANFNNIPSGNIISWVAVIVCLIAFWPVGLFLLLRKISFGAKNRSGTYSQTGPGYRQKPPVYGQYTQSGQTSSAYYARQQPGQQQQGQAQAGQQQQGQQQQGKTGGAAAAYQPFQTGGTPAVRQGMPGSASKQPNYQYNKTQAGQNKQWNVRPDTAKKPDKKQSPAKNLAVALTVLCVVLGIMGVISLASGLAALTVAGMSIANLALGGFFLVGALISGFIRGGVLHRMRRFNKYAAVICDREVVSVSEIARAAGEPVRKTRKWLQDMLDSGYYGDAAYVDNGLDSFVKSREAAERAAGAAEKARHASEAAATAEKEKSSSTENQYVTIVNELHMLCSQTSDPAICGKIERIEALTVKIFKIVEENPEKSPQIRRFMNYYLPTTLKLLRSYQTLERQGVGGENITSAKHDIERILETLASGFEQQLDNLFKADKLDISADIDVIENLMEQDGLTSNGDIMRTAGGN